MYVHTRTCTYRYVFIRIYTLGCSILDSRFRVYKEAEGAREAVLEEARFIKYICVYIYVYLRIYTYICVYVQIRTYTHVQK
jgi:hypothetical protein